MSNKICGDCRHFDGRYNLCAVTSDFCTVEPDYSACDDFEQKQKPTNDDKIRSMSNGELAELFNNCGIDFKVCSSCESETCCNKDCKKAYLAWLNAPAGEDIDVPTEESEVNNGGLKPCPFCGSEIEFISAHFENGWCVYPPTIHCSRCHQDYQGAAVAISDKCDAQREEFSDSLLVSWWNRRPAEEDLKAEIARYRRALYNLKEDCTRRKNFAVSDEEKLFLYETISHIEAELDFNTDTGKWGEDE